MNSDSAVSDAEVHLGKTAGPGLYLTLLGAQTLGAAIIVFNGIPVYRQLVRDFSGHQQVDHVIWWAVAAIAMSQTAYWLRMRLRLPIPAWKHVLLGHLAGFTARLVFVLATSMFAVIFFVRFAEMNLPPRRIILLMAGLFSLYCWTLEFERVARALHGEEVKR